MSTQQQQRVWFITGCSSGFGLELVHAILARGDKVIATARSVQKIAHLKSIGADTLQLDVTSSLDELKVIAEKAISLHGRVDVLINNAAYISQGAIEEVSTEETFRQFSTNVFGVLNVTRAFLPHMRQRKSGTIVIIGSVAGRIGFAGAGLYCSSKFAVEGIAEALRAETKHLGIDVTIVEPGYFRTSLLSPGDNLASATPIPDYEAAVGPARKLMEFAHGKQPGDPKKGAQRIIDVVTKSGLAEGKEIPERIALGSDAYKYIKEKLQETLKNLEEWKDVTESTDFPPEQQ